jgi:transcription elongation factor GreB
MGRYRPPQKPGTKYITPEGEKSLKDELHHLWKIKRPEVTQAVSEAAAQGDRSENAEYIYGKKQLREIDSRVRFLRKRLEDMVVVSRIPDDTSKIYFGAWVSLENEDGMVSHYRLVGPDEFDISKGYLSIDSPLGKLLLKKSIDDEIELVTPNGVVEYVVTNIKYSENQNQS